jgi:hypothetical protein
MGFGVDDVNFESGDVGLEFVVRRSTGLCWVYWRSMADVSDSELMWPMMRGSLWLEDFAVICIREKNEE